MNLRHGILPFVIWTTIGWKLIPRYYMFTELSAIRWAVYNGSFWLCLSYCMFAMLYTREPVTRWERRALRVAAIIGITNGLRECLMLSSRGEWEWVLAFPLLLGFLIEIVVSFTAKKKPPYSLGGGYSDNQGIGF